MSLEGLAEQVPGIVENPARRRQFALLLIAAVILVNGLFHASVYNAWFGPFDAAPKDLVGLKSPPLRRWVRLVDEGRPVTQVDLDDTGIEERTIRPGRSETSAWYEVLRVGDRELLVRASTSKSAGNKGLVGVLVDSPDHAELSSYDGVMLDLDADYGLIGWAVSILGILVILFALDQIRRSYHKPREMPPPLS